MIHSLPSAPPRRPVRGAGAAWFGLAAWAWCAAATAHGLEANHLQIVVHEQLAEVVATPPVEFVAMADANHDGLLNVDEVRARREEIVRALTAALVVTDGDGRRGELDRVDVSVPRGDDDGARGSDFLRLTVVLRWPQAPNAIRVRCGFVMQHPVVLYATHAESLSQPGVLTLVGDGEYSTLAMRDSEATVLRVAPPVALSAPRLVAARPALTHATSPAAAAGALALASLLGALAYHRRTRSKNVPIGEQT